MRSFYSENVFKDKTWALKMEKVQPVKLEITVLKTNAHGNPDPEDEGFVLRSCLAQTIHLYPSGTLAIPTGIKVKVPIGYELQIRSRPAGVKKGLVVAGGLSFVKPGNDSEIIVTIANIVDVALSIKPGMVIASAILCPVLKPELVFSAE